MIVVLGQRFSLEICFGHLESVKYLEQGGASHLQICVSTNADRVWMFSNYPSEPFLSCVAAFILHGKKYITYMQTKELGSVNIGCLCTLVVLCDTFSVITLAVPFLG